MSFINQQGTANPLSVSDLLLVWSTANGDSRKASITALIALIQASVSSPNPPVFLPSIGGTGDAIVAAAPPGVAIAALNYGDSYYFFPVLANTGAVTLNVAGLGAKAVYLQGIPLVGGQISIGVPFIVVYDSVRWNILVSLPVPVSPTQPTRQAFIAAGAAVWNRPVGCVSIKVTLQAPGGGGAGGANATNDATAGGNGGASTFNGITAAGGIGGSKGYGPGAGGTNAPTAGVLRIPGDPGGQSAPAVVSGTNVIGLGGNGGGNGGGPSNNGSHTDGFLNSGGGGSGGSVGSTAFANIAPGAGGGQGEKIVIRINNPAVSYAVLNGAAGTAGNAGTGGVAGGAGALGYCDVEEFYF